MATQVTTLEKRGFSAVPVVAKLGILLVIIGLICGAYFFLLHMPLLDDIESAVDGHATLVTRFQRAHARQSEYRALRDQLAERTQIDRENKRALPEDAEIEDFRGDLERAATQSGVRVTFFQRRPEEAGNLYVRLPATLRLRGTFHQLSRFFYRVSQIRRAVAMMDFTISQSDDTTAEGGTVLTVNVTATTFRRPAEMEATGTPTAGAPVTPATGAEG